MATTRLWTEVTGPGRSNGPLIAAIGDSMTAGSMVNIATVKAFYGHSHIGWWATLSGQRINAPFSYNLGVNGATLGDMEAQAVSVAALSPRPAACVVLGGTNDLASRTLAAMKTSAINIIGTLLNVGILPICLTIPPRSFSMTDTMRRKQAAYNTWLREIGFGRSDLIASVNWAGGYPLVVDVTQSLLDATSATGDPLTNVSYDGLHLTFAGGYWVGKALHDATVGIFPPRPTSAVSSFDFWNATENPTGNLMFSGTTNRGLLAGTSGTLLTNAGLTPTGSLATGFGVFRAAGSSTATLVASKQSPRTDINAGGDRQKIVVDVTGAGTSGEKYQMYNLNIPNASVGDVVVAECSIELSANCVNLAGLGLNLNEVGPGSPQVASTGFDAGNGGTSPVLTGVGYSGILRTPPLTLQSGMTSISTYVESRLKTDGGAAHAEFFIGDWNVRKAA